MYKEYMATLPLPNCAFTINNSEYTERLVVGFRTKAVTGRDSIEANINDITVGRNDGAVYRSRRDLTRSIQVNFDLVADSSQEYHTLLDSLKKHLYQENSKWVFADEPNVFYNGTINNLVTTKLNTANNDAHVSTGYFTIYCSDPYKYSQTLKKATNNGKETITVLNDGSKEVVAEVKAVMTSNSGYFGLVNNRNDRYFQIGNPEEGDSEYMNKSEILFTDYFYEDQGWLLNQGVTPPVTPHRLQEGFVKYEDEGIDPTTGERMGYTGPASYGNNTSGTVWHGPSLTKIVPPDLSGEYAVNWTASFRFVFNVEGAAAAVRPKQTGHQSFTFIDEDGNIIVSVALEDTTPNSENSDMSVYIGTSNSKAYWTNVTPRNALYTKTSKEGGAIVSVEKFGSNITVRYEYGNTVKTLQTTTPNKKLRKITWYAATLDSYLGMQHTDMKSMRIIKHGGDSFSEVPNYFMQGDIIEITGKNEVFINDLSHLDLVDIGSQPLLLEPGENTIGIAVSTFSEVPNVEISFRERWL